MNKRGKSSLFVILAIVIIGLLVWGYIGGLQAQKVGVTCDWGIGKTFCWKWHTNIVGQIAEGINNAVGG